MGDGLEYDDEDDVRPKDFNADLVVSKSLIFVPLSEPSVREIGGVNWPACLPNLYLPEQPRTCEAAFEAVVKRAWNKEPEYDDDERVVGTVHHTEIFRAVRIFVRPVNITEYIEDPEQR
jgi:hypothetical protein